MRMTAIGVKQNSKFKHNIKINTKN